MNSLHVFFCRYLPEIIFNFFVSVFPVYLFIEFIVRNSRVRKFKLDHCQGFLGSAEFYRAAYNITTYCLILAAVSMHAGLYLSDLTHMHIMQLRHLREIVRAGANMLIGTVVHCLKIPGSDEV